MRFLVLLVVVAACVVVAAELVVPPRIEEEVEARVVAEVPEARSVEVEVGSFPVVARGLATGELQRLVVVLDEVAHPEITVDRIQVELVGIDVSRRALLTGDVELQAVDRGELWAVISEADLEDALPGGVVDLELTAGRAEASVAGQTVGSDVVVADGALVFDLGRLPNLTVPLPGPELFPCPLQGEVVEGAVRLGCTLDQVPDYLLRRLDGG